MAFARSQSGPAGLSINTNSANSLFGPTSTPPPAGGMFGSTGASKPGGLFGSATTGASAPQSGSPFGASTTQPASGGLFGSTATATTQPQAGGSLGATSAATTQSQAGGLFGTSTASAKPAAGGLFGSTATTTQPQTGGLFGSTTTTTQPQTGGLFGSAAATSQPQVGGGLFGKPAVAAQPQTEGLFGSTSTASRPQTGGSLFGSNTGGTQAGSSLFGGLNNQNQNKPATSLFGGLGSTQNQQTQPQQNSMFAQSQSQGSGQLGGGLSLGQSNQQNPQTVPGVRIDLSNLRGTTRFNDLYDDLQQQITQLDSVIQGQIKLKNDCDAIMPAHDQQLSQIPGDVAFCNRKLVGVEGALVSDVKSIAFARELVKVDADNAKLSFRAIDNLKLPPQYHNTGIWANSPENRAGSGEDDRDIVGFFSSTADELSSTLNKYQNNVSEIEQHLRGVEAASAQQINAFVARRNGSSGAQEDPVAELAAALREFEQSILVVAGKVGGAREGVQNLQLGGYTAPTNGNQANRRRSGVY